MMCGLCVEACPFSAIQMGKDYELAVTNADDLVTLLLEDTPAVSAKKNRAEKPKPAPDARGRRCARGDADHGDARHHRRRPRMPETVSGIAFGLLAIACVGGALGMLITRNVVHAAFWLLEVMLAIAGLFLLLSAEFMALVQVLVYAGAVSVLLLFVVMLTLRRREDAIRPRDASLPGIAMGLVFLGLVLIGVEPRRVRRSPRMPEHVPDTAALGELLFTEWVLPFEVASLVLLVALVGAVWWSGEGDS